MSEAVSDVSVRRDRQLGAAWMPEMPPVVRRVGKTDAELLKAGICPICGAGHTNRAHGIDRFQLRELVGLYRTETICDPTHAAACAERSRMRYERGDIKWDRAAAVRAPRKLSKKAVALNREKLKKARLVNDPAKVAREAGRRRLEAAAERDAEIVALWNKGDTIADICRLMGGIVPSTTRRALERAGIEVNEASARYHESRRGSEPEAFRRGRERMQARMAQERAELADAIWGGESVHIIAERLGITAGNLRGRLKRHGIVLPDGRADPHRRKPPPRPKAEPWYCTLEGCDEPGRARGLCSKHYQQAMKRRTSPL